MVIERRIGILIIINDIYKFQESMVTFAEITKNGIKYATLEITVDSNDYNSINSIFVDNIKIIRKPEGINSLSKKEQNLSDFSVAGDIIDHRDGTFTIQMRRKTSYELAQEKILALEKENAEMLFQNLTGEDFEE